MEPVTIALAIGSVLGGFALLNKKQQQEATPQSLQDQDNAQPDLLTSILGGESGDIVSGVVSEIGQVLEDPEHLNVILFGVNKEEARAAILAKISDFRQIIEAGAGDQIIGEFVIANPKLTAPTTSDGAMRSVAMYPLYEKLRVAYGTKRTADNKSGSVDYLAVCKRFNLIRSAVLTVGAQKVLGV